MTEQRRRIRQKGGSALESLLYALDFDELLTAWVRLGGPNRGGRPKSINDAVDRIESSGRSVAEIEETLRTVEAESPKAHCFFLSIGGSGIAASINSLLGATVAGAVVTRVSAVAVTVRSLPSEPSRRRTG